MVSEECDEISYPFPNFNHCTVWKSNSSPYYILHVNTYHAGIKVNPYKLKVPKQFPFPSCCSDEAIIKSFSPSLYFTIFQNDDYSCYRYSENVYDSINVTHTFSKSDKSLTEKFAKAFSGILNYIISEWCHVVRVTKQFHFHSLFSVFGFHNYLNASPRSDITFISDRCQGSLAAILWLRFKR